MSRGAHAFKQTDVTKAIKALAKSGLPGRVEIVRGKIVVVVGKIEDDGKRGEWD